MAKERRVITSELVRLISTFIVIVLVLCLIGFSKRFLRRESQQPVNRHEVIGLLVILASVIGGLLLALWLG